MSAPLATPIAIIGAGLSGLTLSLLLRAKHIPHRLYDRAHSVRPYNYGITLYGSTYQPLFRALWIDERLWRAEVAVDAGAEGQGRIVGLENEAMRCHRGRLETLLRDESTLNLGKSLAGIYQNDSTNLITASFDDGSSIETQCLIGCDGPHSTVRQILAPSVQLSVLPYVAFNGKRRIPNNLTFEWIDKHMDGSCLKSTRKGDRRLEISINDINDHFSDMTYTYSRPVYAVRDHEKADPLHAPERDKAAATQIPEAFFEEIAALRDLEPPFDQVFDVAQMRQDRILHWLMRTVQPDEVELERLAKSNIVLLGDAAHATPILGGNGANEAIRDAVELAGHIERFGARDFDGSVRTRIDGWRQSVSRSEEAIRDMH